MTEKTLSEACHDLADAIENLRDCISAYMSNLDTDAYRKFCAFDREELRLNYLDDKQVEKYVAYLGSQAAEEDARNG